jgi:16S rRNA (cytidine1402-2'-O)-methyltransferase
MTALAASGFPADAFTFLGFPPIKAKDRATWLKRLAAIGGTIVFFEAPHRIRPTLEEILARIGDQPAVVCRELTKVHETLVRGPISSVIGAPRQTQGELTVVIHISHTTESVSLEPATERELAIQFGEITESSGLTKRKAINILARRHGRPPNEIYKAVERGRKLVQ